MAKKGLLGKELYDGSLRKTYKGIPFSVFDTRAKQWGDRKHEWLSYGIKSEIGRGDGKMTFDGIQNLTKDKTLSKSASVFDPVLTELMYRWFCKKDGIIFDPFAGGSVRGIVAHKLNDLNTELNLKYIGIELRKEQVISNRKQSVNLLKKGNQPVWYIGDSERILKKYTHKLPKFDLLFTCPPYFDLEVYSKEKGDLSNMDDVKFTKKYIRIIKKSCALLKPNGYACFVIGNVRGKDGFFKDLVKLTKNAFRKAGLKLYNDAILLNATGTARLRTKGFAKNQKLVKVHQNVLIFKRPINKKK